MTILTAGVATIAHGDPGEAPSGACAGDNGVSVVVDSTDVGGDVVIGCAGGDPASGREALEAAGFTPADSAPGMICAIDGTPDPCPTEFDGTYWSYWSAEPDGEWTAYQVGADTADPAPGTLEGWRLNDGSSGPGVAPADVVAAAKAAPTAAAATQEATPASAGPSTSVWVGAGLLVVALLSVAANTRRRRRA